MLLTVNAGSSSLKLAVFDAAARTRAFEGVVAEIGGDARMKAGAETVPLSAPDHLAALDSLRGPMREAGLALETMQAAGHRVVHGGDAFTAPTRIDDAVLAALDALSPLAPLHNPPALAAIRAVAQLAPDLPQAACFDTAFHAHQPEVATTYALPAELRARGFRRYGFHGLSYEGLTRAVFAEIGRENARRLLALHLGNGASVCAILDGVSVATSMGYSPLDGLTMGTRSGALDPTVALALAREMGADAAERVLTRESGLKGLSGGVSDMRALEASNAPEAAFAIEHFCYWAARHTGSMIAAMGGVDAIAFTGGIGEHAASVRARIEALLAWTGAPSMVIPADEEAVIAADAAQLFGLAPVPDPARTSS